MDALAFAPVSIFFGKATAAAGTTSTLTTTGTMVYSIRGKAFSRAAFTNQATPTLDFNTGLAFSLRPIPPGFGSVYLLMLDSGTALRAAQGTIEALDNVTTTGATANFINAPQFPVTPDNATPFAYVVVKVGTAGAAWTFGTSNLTGPPANTGIAFVDIVGVPDRVQVS